MTITQQEAQVSLSMIEQTQVKMRRAIAATYSSELLLLWGGIWLIGFVALHFSPHVGGMLFGGLDVLGIILSWLIAKRWPQRTSFKKSPSSTRHWTIPVFLGALILFGSLWAWLLKPDSSLQACVYVCTLCMFGYVMIGLWFRAPFMIGLGLSVAVLSLVGYTGLREYFYLWMAPMGGGILFGTGLYIQRWK